MNGRAQITKPFPYNLTKPDKHILLPDSLMEVSGISDFGASSILCVQDELGIVFVYDFIRKSITAQYRFDSVGDFEGLTWTGKDLYVLRSDGRLTEWQDFPSSVGKINHFSLPLLTRNNEGLCYDEKTNRVLVAAKSKPRAPGLPSSRLIYAFDVKEKKLNEWPFIELDIDTLQQASVRFGLVDRTADSGKGFRFRAASLAIHPLSAEIYIISASDFRLVVLDKVGNIKSVQALDPMIFPKAEGISFLPDGTMLITNEGKLVKPSLLFFKYQGM